MTAKIDDSFSYDAAEALSVEALADTCQKMIDAGMGSMPVVLAIGIDAKRGLAATMCIASGGIKNKDTGQDVALVLTSNYFVAASMRDSETV